MNDTIPESVMDKLTKVCTCKGISRAAVKKAIQNGCNSVEAVNQSTGTGSGACGGKNCGPRIEALLKKE